MRHYETQKSRETIFEGRVFSAYRDKVELENGKTVDREIIEHNGGVAVVAVNEDGKILMVRQFRYGAGKELWELPAGKLDQGEDPKSCGLRELREETGYIAGKCEFLTSIYPTPAYDSELISIYLATELGYKGQSLDADEFLSVEWMELERVLSLCMDGSIQDAKTLAGILLYSQRLQTLA